MSGALIRFAWRTKCVLAAGCMTRVYFDGALAEAPAQAAGASSAVTATAPIRVARDFSIAPSMGSNSTEQAQAFPIGASARRLVGNEAMLISIRTDRNNNQQMPTI
ncbi:hypothetical protein [Bradyrhizobium sp. th.b2]|uniref:hypothetical protein n=1 Tax=Bradyrhizobium sp. th-b2 TaxID=172088 RepID=UPI0012EBF95D|nr:hypothetical protein [Bradyrhizobium sp. th.b2]